MRVAKGGEPSPPFPTARADQPAIAREPALTPEVWSVLTPRQSEVVASIRLRAATGRGLNLTAVKREDPRLVAEVFSMRPYWGWRRAIETAGLRYDRIPISLEDTLECLVCGRRLRSLIGHLSVSSATNFRPPCATKSDPLPVPGLRFRSEIRSSRAVETVGIAERSPSRLRAAFVSTASSHASVSCGFAARPRSPARFFCLNL